MKLHAYTLLLELSIGIFTAANLPKPSFARTTKKAVKYLTAEESDRLHLQLLNNFTFSIEQIIELNGLSCAVGIYKVYNSLKRKNTLVVTGNRLNGAEGLVCARHLVLYNFNVTLHYPKVNDRYMFRNLYKQCRRAGVKIAKDLPSMEELKNYDLIVDSLFEFSPPTPLRPIFKKVTDFLNKAELPICSIDIPSGWDLEKGPSEVAQFQPELLISLKAPKKGAAHFKGKHHYIGGRYIPLDAERAHNLNLPPYPGIDCVVKLK